MPRNTKGKGGAKAVTTRRPGPASGGSTARTAPADPAHAAAARKAAFGAFTPGLGRGMGFGAGMSLGTINTAAYTNAGGGLGTGAGMLNDVPQYFQIMNENNGGMLYWPVTLKEKYSWYRYFATKDPFVSRAVQFHTDLPMSKLILRMPKMKNEDKRQKILKKFEGMVKRLKLFERLHSILYEMNVIGNCFIYADYDEERREWGRLVILPPEEILISRYPMSDNARVQYRPEILAGLASNYRIPVDSEEAYQAFVAGLPLTERGLFADVSYEVACAITQNNGVLDLDTDPFTGEDGNKIGSFVYHFSLQRHEYFDLGVSPLECVLTPLLMKEHYKYTQLSLASRNMTPRSKVTAPDTSEAELASLREQIDMSMLNPDYSIVTNFDWNWELIGAENRLIDLAREYETIENQLFAGLGVTREILTGEGMYSGSKISVELLNTRYLFMRDMLTHYVEESLFLPIAEENGFYEIDEWGNKNYFYPKLSFTRLSIRDNSEVFDSLFQLYQKGSLPIDVILELFNLDSDEIHEKLKQDMFTVKDSTYNDMVRSVYGEVAGKVVEETNLADQIIAYLRGPDGKPLAKKAPEGEEGGNAGGPDGGMGGMPFPPAGNGEAPPAPDNGGDTPAGDASSSGDAGGDATMDYLDQLISDAQKEEAAGDKTAAPESPSAPEGGELVGELL
ncbi:MAG: hypothetical protein II943_03535 [Victivallales bacterium]|nr:hypothetical protein [Victivallales bacterium]